MTSAVMPSFTAFLGCRRIATGSLEANVLAVRRAAETGPSQPLLIFDDRTGRVVDVDIRGSDAETLARLSVVSQDDETTDPEPAEASETPLSPRGRGRPKLGVIAREVTLLPRHWDWLSAQPGGASVTLRKLVDAARRETAARDETRRAQERAYQFMSTMAGDMAGFEESTRALFAGDSSKFLQLTAGWPGDVRDYALRLASYADA
jgi:hypothetical protein